MGSWTYDTMISARVIAGVRIGAFGADVFAADAAVRCDGGEEEAEGEDEGVWSCIVVVLVLRTVL